MAPAFCPAPGGHLSPSETTTMTVTTILPLGSLVDASEGGQQDVDISALSRQGKFIFQSKSAAGTNPTNDVKLQHSDGLTRGATYNTVGASDHELREGGTTKVRLAAKFTQSGARQVKRVALMLKKQGTITAGGKLTLKVETNNAGVPSGTVLGTSATVDIDTEVGTTYAWVVFTFAKPVDLADGATAHFALEGDYTASGTNNVCWRANTVASGGNQSTHNNTSWTAVTTESHEFYTDQHNFADVTGGAFTQVGGTTSAQVKELNVDSLRAFVRAHVTIGGTSTPEFYTGISLVTQD